MSKSNPFPSLFKNDSPIKKTYFFVNKPLSEKNKSNSIFGKISEKTNNNIFNSNIFIDNRVEAENRDYKTNTIFGNNINHNFLDNDKQEKIGRDNKIKESKEITKCNHNNFYIAYCTSNNKNDGGLLCYDCLYKYHQNHISQCLPIKKKRALHYYNKNYKKYINMYKKKLDQLYGSMDSILKYFENEKIDDISTLFENKLNLNFDLPIEIPFIDRFEIAINKKLTYYLKKKINNFDYIFLNLFKTDLDKLKYFYYNHNNYENIKFISSVQFNLYGIGTTKNSRNPKIEIFKGNKIIENTLTFKEYDNDKRLSIFKFDPNPLEIEKDIEYSIVFKEIKGFFYLDGSEQYNENSKIKISSSNSETILVCLIVSI